MADTVVTKQETVETLNADGTPLGQNKNLSDIFDQIEAGKPAEEAINDVMSRPEVVTNEPEVKREEPAPEKKEEVAAPEQTLEERTKREEKVEAKPDDKVEEKVEEEVVPDDELQVLPHDKPKTQKRIQALLRKIDSATNEAATTKQELAAKAAKLLEMEEELKKTKGADPIQSDEIKQQLADLKMYRRKYELDKDPEIKQKFDSRLESTETSIIGTLKHKGAGEGLINLIKEEGGWAKFSDSQRTITLADGTKTTATELAESILGNLSYKERKEIDAAVVEQVTTTRERQRFFEEESKNAEKYFQAKADEEAQQRQKVQKQMDEGKTVIEGWKAKVNAFDWLKEQPVPANAKPEEKAAIEDDNKYAKQIRQVAMKHVEAKTLPEILELLDDAVLYHQQRRENSKLLKQIEAYKAKAVEFEKFKAASTTPKKGSLASGGSPAPERTESRPLSLEERLERMEGGAAAE